MDSKTENSDNGTQAGGYLFRKRNEIGEYDYYLGISSDAKLLRKQEGIRTGQYERLDYYQPKSASVYGNSYTGDKSYGEDKQVLIDVIHSFIEQLNNNSIKQEIKIAFSKLKDEAYTPSALVNILSNNYQNVYHDLLSYESFKKENRRVSDNLHNTILSLNRIPGSKKYKNISFDIFIDAQKAIEELCKEKVFNYYRVPDEEMEELLDRKNKPLLLFKITNKDLSYAENFINGKRKEKRGTENLHTIYFKALMDGNQSRLDIGTGKVFYRKKSIEYDEKILQNGHHHTQLEDKFSYPIIKDRRYAYDKFLFHLSITQNYNPVKNFKNFDNNVNTYLYNSNNIHIIGIDRGERHLLYLTLIDMQGNIIKQFSLNEIINEFNGKTFTTNYHDLLNKREGERADARQNWKTIESIKELKEGYMSHVIHKISQLMVKYNAIVVLEDLNLGFKQGRQKIEKQVYQKFEKMLIDKLNYLVDKKKAPEEPGGI